MWGVGAVAVVATVATNLKTIRDFFKPKEEKKEKGESPASQTFDEAVGTVGNQGTIGNAAGKAGNQIGSITNFYQGEAPTPQAIPAGIPHQLPRLSAETFVGRNDELDRLHQYLQTSDRVAISAIAGMGGIGKTELALQYAYLHAQDYPGGLCWLRARGSDLGGQVMAFAQVELGLTLPDSLELPQQVAYCWKRWRPEGDALIVVDDVTDYPAIEPYLPSDNRFKLLLTSRQRFGSPIQRLDLDVLEAKPALALLQSLVKDDRMQADPRSAHQLIEWVGRLPLGIELIGRYLAKAEDLSLQAMLERLEQQRLKQPALLNPSELMTAERGVAEAFELSWHRLTANAQQLACLLASLAPAPIAWTLVKSAVAALSLADLEPAQQELRGLNLLQRKDKGVYQLHPLLREFLTTKVGERADQEAIAQAVCQTVVAVAKTIPQTPTLKQIAQIELSLPHLEEVATALQSGLSDEDWIWIFTALGNFWKGQGAYTQAELWVEQGLAVARDRFGDDHLATATSLNNLAGLYRDQGRYGEAEPLYIQALEISCRLLGEDHPGTASSLNNLAGL